MNLGAITLFYIHLHRYGIGYKVAMVGVGNDGLRYEWGHFPRRRARGSSPLIKWRLH